MADQEDSFLRDDDEDDGGMFAHLAPQEEEKPVKKKNHLAFIGNLQDEKNVKKIKGRQGKARQVESTRERSRSQERTARKEEARDSIILISDDEENYYAQTKYAKLQRNLMEEHGYGSYDHMNHRQRRKLDRLFERELRYFKEGKPKDRLSNSVFNAIEEYFR